MEKVKFNVYHAVSVGQ